jgi:hypothetical protein
MDELRVFFFGKFAVFFGGGGSGGEKHLKIIHLSREFCAQIECDILMA